MSKTIKNRDQIDRKYKWNIESMYMTDVLWEKDLEKALKLAEEFATYQGSVTKNSETLLKILKLRDETWLVLERAFIFARMKRDEDNRKKESQEMCDKAQTYAAQVGALMSFFTPELLETDEKVLLSYINENKELEIYKFMITDILREKAHVLTKAEENILAQMGEITPATGDIFTILNNADLAFGKIKDDDGNLVDLTHGNYINFMESQNREVREGAYTSMYNKYKELINTIATTYNYNTKTDVVTARIRKYEDARSAALSSDNVSSDIYDNLIDTVHKGLPAHHKYMNIRKKILGLEKIKMHDIYVPLVEPTKNNIPYEKGLDIMREGLAPLGKEYIDRMNSGIAAGWIDVYENAGKTSGAYSFGSYDSLPFILLNYTDKLKDVFTIVHEMGHSMHSSYTREEQPFIYGSHSIFTAEVASTVNENLLMKHLIKNETDPQQKKYLLNLYIEEFRATVFRQTMFAEFEKFTHETLENGGTLTAESMCNKYEELNKFYFGEALGDDPLIKYEWARIPHFYNAFYVYKYATGYSAASAISDIILEKGPTDYLNFLKTGDSNYPIELLKIAGVDMSTSAPIERAMNIFADLVNEFEKLV